jgi:MprA protease rhombosortase-interaction domain-containing protein
MEAGTGGVVRPALAAAMLMTGLAGTWGYLKHVLI